MLIETIFILHQHVIGRLFRLKKVSIFWFSYHHFSPLLFVFLYAVFSPQPINPGKDYSRKLSPPLAITLCASKKSSYLSGYSEFDKRILYSQPFFIGQIVQRTMQLDKVCNNMINTVLL